jgi:hypothetical protein
VALEIVALVLTLVVHFIGAWVLIWGLMDGDRIGWRSLWPRDDDGGGGGGAPWRPDELGPSGGGTVVSPPLPAGGGEFLPSGVRLREPGRISEGHPVPARRPDHAPQRPRVPERG